MRWTSRVSRSQQSTQPCCPKQRPVRVVYDKDGTKFTVKEDRGKTLLLEGEKGNVVLRPARQFTDAVPGGDQAPTDGLGDAPRTVSHPDPAIDGQAVIAETGDGRVVVANPNNKGGVSVVTDRGDGLGDAPRLRGVETNEAGETTFAGETENQIEERRQFERDTAQITPQQVRNLATDKQVPLTEFEADHLDNMSPDNLRTVTRRILGVSNDGLGDAPRGELVNGEPDEALRSVVGDKLKSLDRAIFPRIVTNEQGDRLRVPEAMLDEYDAMAKRGAAPEEWHALAKRVPAETQTQADDEILFSATDPAGPTMTKEAIVAQIAATHPGADIETTKAIMPDGDYHAIEVPLSAIWQVYGKAGQEKVHDYASRKTQAPAIVVNDMHEVVDGKHRFRAAQLRGDKTIRVWAPVGVTLKSVAAADDAMPWAVVDEKPINAKIADLVLDPDGIATARARYVHDPNYRHTNTEPVAVERQADGKLHVLDGYHRIEQARRDGQAAVVVKVVREAAPVVESTDGQATTSTEERGLSDPSRVRGSSGVLADPYGPNKGDDLANKPEPLRVPGYKNRIDFGGFKPAQDAARAYAAEAGLDYQPQTEYVPLDKERAARIADEFEKLVHDPQNPEVAAAYKAMLDETMAQYRHILDTGLKVEFIDYEKQGDPYARSPRLAVLDVVENNHLWVFSTRDGFGSDDAFDASDNPLLGETEFEISGQPALANDIFRVVHDYFGHIKDGVGFRARGEENAWASHSRMYSPLARRAMTTETRGQNSYVNFGPWAEYNKTASAADTHYADQKIGLLPEWVSRLDSENDLSSTRPGLYQDRTGSTVESTETMDGVTDRQSSTAGVSSALSGGRNARGASTSEAIPQPSSSGGMVSPDTDTAASLGQGDRRRAESGAGPPEGTVERRNDLADTATRRRSGIRDRRQKPGTQAQVFGQNDLAGLERVERRSDAVDRRQADVGSAAADSLKNVTEPPSRSSVDLLSDPPRAKKLLGLGKVATVREIGEALDKYTIEHGGKIEKTDRSEAARNAIARGLSDEAKYQIEASSNSGLGWYSENYPRALEALANVYPEFKTNPAMKDVFTAVLAVTSNGERVAQNMANATKVYDAIRKGGKPSQIELGTKRQGAFAANMRALEDLLSQVGPAGLRDALLRTTTVGEINKQLKAKGITPATAYPADASMPMSVLHFGPKLGAFAANLMGSEGYLTMDLWWTRSFNRHRGILTPQPTQAAINSLRSFLDPGMTDDDVIQATPELAGLYASKERNYHTELELKLGRKEGTNNADKAEFWAKAKSEIGPRILKRLTIEHRAEKLANTIYKDAFKELNEAPFNSGDRAFMIDTAVATQKLLKAGGLDLSVADIQAALWYYEKRLYASLGKIEKASKGGISDLGYEEAIRDAADSYRPRGSTSWLDRQPQSQAEVGADQGPDEADDILRNVATAAPPSAQRLEHDLASARREYDNYKRFFEKHQPGSAFGSPTSGQTTLPDAAAVEAKLATFKKAYDDAQAAWNEFQRSRPKAPNGKPSNLSPEHHALVRTPEFKEYFGDWEKWAVDGKTVWDAPPGEVSVVVDQNGEPLVVYHGTTKAGFAAFEAERGQKVKGAIFFTTRRNNAATYSGTLDEANVGLPDDADDATRGIYSAFLNIRDPYETHFEGAYWNGARDHQYVVETDDGEVLYDPETGKGYFNDRLDAIAVKAHYEETGQYTRDEMHVQEAPEHDETTDSAAREGLNSSDGTIIRDVVDPGPLFEGYSDEADLFIVHDARQIKSVHNQGTFNADDPNILKSVRPADADDQIAYWNDAHTEDVLTGTTGGVIHDNGEWEISLADAQLFNRILKQYRTKQLGRPVVEHSFDGITLSTDMLTKLADHAVSDTRPALVKLGYTNDQLQGLDALVKQMRAMVKRGKSHGLAYVYEDVLPEERVHLEDFQAGRTSAAAMAKLMQHAIWQNPGRKFTREYGHQSDSAKASEFAAKLATNQAAKYGWDKLDDFDNLKKEFLRIWADGIIDKNRARIEEDGWEQFAKDFPTIAEYAKDPTPDTTGNAEASGEPGPVQGDRGTGQETGPPETTEEAPQQERDQGRSDGSTTPPERGLSRVGASIEAQAVAAKLAESFQGTAEYDPITVEDQAARATELVDTDLPRVRKILRGSEQLPTGLRAASVIAAVENYARDTGDADLLRDLAKSKLVSETSLHAQELRMLRERDPWGPGKLVQEIQSILDQKPKPTSSLTADPEADLAAAQAELDQKLADLDAEIERRATEMAETNAKAELDRILGEPRPSQYVIDLAKAAVKKIDDGAEAARKRLKERFGTAPAKSVAATDEILKSATDPLQPHPVTDTEEFRQWFGDSKVVDDIGEPLVVYHGTDNSFDTFEQRKGVRRILFSQFETEASGFFFAEDEPLAKEYGAMVMPVYLSLQNPADFTGNTRHWDKIENGLVSLGWNRDFFNHGDVWEWFDGEDGKKLVADLKTLGFDGAKIQETGAESGQGDAWVAFKPSQIKSAIGNRGTFDPNEDSILKSVSDDDIKDFAKVGASYLAKMDINRDGFRDAMVAEFGPEIEPDIDEIYTEAKNIVQRATGKKVAGAKKAADKGTIRDRIAAAIQKDQTADVTALVQQLARGHVEKGVSDRDALLNAVHKDLEDIVPDITRREAMDMISGYGKYRQLSKDATAAILRDLKGQMQQIAKLEDMAAGEAPKKTGAERRKASDEERRLIQQVEDAKKKGGYNVTDPETQLRTALAAAKTRLKNQIKDLDDQIRTRRKILKTKTRLEYDAEANDLKRQRDELKKTFDEVFGPTPRTPMTDAQRLEAWKKRASRRMEELKTKLDAGDYAPTPKRPPVELDAAAKAVKADLDRIQARIEMLRGINGEVPKEVVEEVNRLANDIERTREAYAADPTDENRMAWGYAQEDLRQYVAKIKNEANRWTLEEIKKHPIAAAKAGLTGVAGNSKAIRAALDDSAVFRQGWKTLLTHPGIWAQNAYKSFYHAIKVWGVESVMRELNADLLSRPNAERYRKAKLAVVGPYEEEFPEAWIEKVPIAGRPFKSSQNAYTAFVQKTRADVFDYYLGLAEKAGLDINDPEILQPIGRLVNSLTGRGDLGDYNPGAFTNNVFFSLRFLKSHIDVLGGQAITGAVKRGKAHEPKTEADREARDAAARFVRKRAILNLVKILVAQGVILATAQAIAKAFGIDDAVEWDPRSSDFGKIKIGNTRFDVSGGSSSFITVAARLAAGSTKTGGKITPLEGGWGKNTRLKVLTDFILNKLAPLPATVHDWLDGENFDHEKPTAATTIRDLTEPMPSSNFREIHKDPFGEKHPGFQAVVSAADFFGIGTNTYTIQKKKSRRSN
jgi:HAMP domain-containing protein